MKKIILFAAILFAGASVVKAQGNTSSAAAATEKEQSILTVRLKPYQTIDVTGNAEIVFDSKEDYEAKEKAQSTGDVNVSVSSAGGFTVKIYAADLELTSNTDKKIAAENIRVLATAQGESVKNDITEDVTLKNDISTLIQSDKGRIDNSYTVAFKAINGEVFRAAYDGNGSNTEEQVYTTTVYYEIAAK